MGPAEAFAKGLEAKVPYIVGSNSLEFPAPAAAVEQALSAMAKDSPSVSDLQASYPDPATYRAQVLSDLLFTEPALNLAARHAANGQATWVYRFSVLSSAMRTKLQGAPHASERQYVFETLKTSPWPTDVTDAIQAKTMSGYWVSFAKTGDPNGGGRPAWPRYDRAHDQILDFTNDGPVVTTPPRRRAIDAIAEIFR
jgi:para-nitrobenzyl esterase